ncbi:hypothetical protein BT67DRAFT_240804 [Trichocladium antarcticum]|uniref:Uncharacterized protein n=1 Tax=Trichocladium antarcticum TaxID=1450529 RepID=A0AAN6UCT6_9PEZI|nr:hypothetical protein BT67DRAFT_240804 [Trichocladium antarcticum]
MYPCRCPGTSLYWKYSVHAWILVAMLQQPVPGFSKSVRQRQQETASDANIFPTRLPSHSLAARDSHAPVSIPSSSNALALHSPACPPPRCSPSSHSLSFSAPQLPAHSTPLPQTPVASLQARTKCAPQFHARHRTCSPDFPATKPDMPPARCSSR